MLNKNIDKMIGLNNRARALGRITRGAVSDQVLIQVSNALDLNNIVYFNKDKILACYDTRFNSFLNSKAGILRTGKQLKGALTLKIWVVVSGTVFIL
jgi:hypothetical protein